MAQCTPLREGLSFSSSRYARFAAGQREGNSSILWKRRHDPGLPAALPFIHGFRPNSIPSFWRVGPQRQLGSEVETNAHYPAIERQSARTTLPADRMLVKSPLDGTTRQ